jgi:hypothetical protein
MIGTFQPEPGGWRAWVETNPAINVLGRTLPEARENLKAAMGTSHVQQDDQENGATEREDRTSTSEVNKYMPRLLSKNWVRL